jgi:predicted protein tyrosine phosphatase
MKLIVKSRRLAEQSNTLKGPHVIISIRNPGSKPVDLALNPDTVGVIYFKFDDIDRMPAEGSSTWHVLGKKPILFDVEMARGAVEFLRENIKEHGIESVIVHCEAGISRSAGMAAVNRAYNPNRLVYRLMLEALHVSERRQ